MNEQKQKTVLETALELIDEFIVYNDRVRHLAPCETEKNLFIIKSAIERDFARSYWNGVSFASDLVRSLKSDSSVKAYLQKDSDSYKNGVQDALDAIESHLHPTSKETAQKTNKQKDNKMNKTALELVDELRDKMKSFDGTVLFDCVEQIKSAIEREQANAITMRPISELPDKVPDGCGIALVDENEIKYSVHGATNFYILPLPVKERKLKPCPWCKAIPRAIDPLKDEHIKYYHLKHSEDCPIRNITHIPPADAKKWGWE